MKEEIKELKSNLNNQVAWLKACDQEDKFTWNSNIVTISGNHARLILKLIEDFEEK